jgi:hypothetical protein
MNVRRVKIEDLSKILELQRYHLHVDVGLIVKSTKNASLSATNSLLEIAEFGFGAIRR